MNETPQIPAGADGPVRQFWRLWHQGGPPDVRAFLAERAGALTPGEVAAVLHLDQYERWRLGDAVPAEAYLEQFPDLAADPEAALDLVYGEFVLRQRLGETPAPEEYRQRFPHLASLLGQQLALQQAINSWSSADGGPRSTLKLANGSGRPAVTPGWPDVPGYEIESELGRGGMGVVYKARQAGLNRPVALKMIRDAGQVGAEQLVRFRREAEAVARLQHPNIVQIYEVGERPAGDAGPAMPYLALEFVDGGNLAARLAGKSLPPAEMAALLETLARAVQAAHARGIVHRDLKPANVLLQQIHHKGTKDTKEAGQSPDSAFPLCSLCLCGELFFPKVTDFGLAKLLDSGTRQTETGDILGTPCYMAPEQARGQTAVMGPATDIYALGAVLYECLTGRPPFVGATTMETLLQVVHQEPVPPSRLQPKVPRDLETICLKCLQKEPARRYGSAAELAADLRHFLDGEPIRARSAGWPERALRWARRRPAAALALVLGALLTLGVAAAPFGYVTALRRELDNARAEWARETARAQAEEEARKDAERRAAVRGEAQELIHQGEAAAAANDWQAAQARAGQALTRTADDERLRDLRERAERLQGRAKEQLDAARDYPRFLALRDQALFHGGLVPGIDQPADPEATVKAARAALAVVGVRPEEGAALALGPGYGEHERAVVTAGCYELLLVLADAVAPPGCGPESARQALRIINRAARLGMDSQSQHRQQARYLAQLGDEARAREAAMRAAGRPPAGALDHFLAGRQHYNEGQLGTALADFEKALHAQADHFWATYYLALCHLRLHHRDAALAGLTACIGRRAEFPWLYLLRGLVHAERKDFAAAEADMRAALDACGPDDDARYAALASRAALRVPQGRTAAALQDLETAIGLRPKRHQAYLTLAQVYQQEKAWDKAARQLETALRLAGDVPALYRARALLAVERGETVVALGDFQRAAELEPADSPARADDHVERGRIFQGLKRYGEALQAYDAALAMRSDLAPALRGRGEALLELKEYQRAAATFDQYLKHGPPTAEVYRLRGLARHRGRDRAGALDDYTRALDLKPTATLYILRGWLHLDDDAAQAAWRDFNKALAQDNPTGEAYAGRGQALALLGKHHEAVADAEQAVKLGPASLRLLYAAARTYALAFGRLDAQGAKGREADLRLQYQTEAIRLVRKALDQLPASEQPAFGKETMRPDHAFDPLRRSSQELRNLEAALADRLPR